MSMGGRIQTGAMHHYLILTDQKKQIDGSYKRTWTQVFVRTIPEAALMGKGMVIHMQDRPYEGREGGPIGA